MKRFSVLKTHSTAKWLVYSLFALNVSFSSNAYGIGCGFLWLGKCPEPEASSPIAKVETKTQEAQKNSDKVYLENNEYRETYEQRGCREAKDDFKNQLTKFNSGCAKAGYASSTTGGSFGCSNLVLCCSGTTSACNGISSGTRKERRDLSKALKKFEESIKKGNSGEDVRQSKEYLETEKMYQQCPMRSAVGMDADKEIADEMSDELEEKEEALNEAKMELQEAQAELEEKKAELEQQMRELEEKTQSELDEHEQKIKELNDENAQKISDKEAEISQLTTQIAGVQAQKAEEGAKLEASITKLEATCYTSAVTKTNELRQAVIKKIESNEYSSGGAKKLFRSVGKSTTQQSDDKVNYYYKRCKKEKTYRDQVRLLTKAHNRLIKAYNKQIQALQNAITSAKQEIGRLKTQVQNEIVAQALKEIQRIQQRYQNAVANLQRQYQNLVNSMTQKIALLQEKVMQKQAHYQAAGGQSGYKQALLGLRDRYRNGKSLKEDDWNDLQAAFFNAQSAASSVKSNCSSTEAADAVKFLDNSNSSE